ncbi:MAG: Uma2 family endonuclease [Deltaproteobacteria bacterium]|nr:Uma2 family endonuclease [Deltaproteobacteria bacterium]
MTAEVIEGELYVMPRPRRQHARGAGRLQGRLKPFDDPEGDDPGGWTILPEPELHLGPLPDIVVPDLAGWRREHTPEDFLAPDAPAHIDLPPAWVCEILSPSTEVVDRTTKMRLWRREKVGHVWLLSPELRTLEVYALATQETSAGARDRYTLVETFEGDARVRAEPFEVLELDLSALWAR